MRRRRITKRPIDVTIDDIPEAMRGRSTSVIPKATQVLLNLSAKQLPFILDRLLAFAADPNEVPRARQRFLRLVQAVGCGRRDPGFQKLCRLARIESPVKRLARQIVRAELQEMLDAFGDCLVAAEVS